MPARRASDTLLPFENVTIAEQTLIVAVAFCLAFIYLLLVVVQNSAGRCPDLIFATTP